MNPLCSILFSIFEVICAIGMFMGYTSATNLIIFFTILNVLAIMIFVTSPEGFIKKECYRGPFRRFASYGSSFAVVMLLAAKAWFFTAFIWFLALSFNMYINKEIDKKNV